MAALLLTVCLQGTTYAGSMTQREADPSFMAATGSTTQQMEEVTGRGYWKTVYQLVKWNIKIYGRLGWEIGRYEALRKYNIDIGKYPGASKVTEQWFKAHFN